MARRRQLPQQPNHNHEQQQHPNQHQPQQPRSHTTSTRRAAAKNAAFREKLRQMALPLAPLVQVSTGRIHPDFPRTLLCFWLLTDAQLDALAHFYHQATPSAWTREYPCPVPWSVAAPLETKRRLWGRFIGLRGCESPFAAPWAVSTAFDVVSGRLVPPPPAWVKTEEEIMEQARRDRIEEEELRKKMWYR